jgi:hypothetical protein
LLLRWSSLFVPRIEYTFHFFEFIVGKIFVDSSYCALVTAKVSSVTRIVRNFLFDPFLIDLFYNVPDLVSLL